MERCAFDVGEEEEEEDTAGAAAAAAAAAESRAALDLLLRAAARVYRGAAGVSMALPLQRGVERGLLSDIVEL